MNNWGWLAVVVEQDAEEDAEEILLASNVHWWATKELSAQDAKASIDHSFPIEFEDASEVLL